MAHETVRVQKEALELVVSNGKGPYIREQDGVSGRYWHKTDHCGPDSCAGCAIEEALRPVSASP